MKRPRSVAALLASMMILGACGGNGASDETSAGAEGAPIDTDATEPGEFGVTDEALTNQTVVERVVIRTGQMEIQVGDTRAAMDEITRLVDRSGGYVSSSEVNPSGNDGQPYVTLTVRIPAGDLDTALAAIRELSDEVVHESIQSQDVTEEYVDIEARLRNLTALETELVALLAEVRTRPDADPQKILTVFSEVSRVRGEIEVLEGRRRLIENQASLSTITVTISPSPGAVPIVDEGWAPLVTVRNAAGDLVEALRTIANAGIWLVVFALPVLLLIAVPVWAALRILKRVSHRRQASVETPSVEPQPVDQD